MYFTRSSICSLVSLPSYAGILSLPLVMMVVRSASDLPCTSAEPMSFKPNFLPIAVSPLPSAPWHAAHFALKSPPPSANDHVENMNETARTTSETRINVLILFSPRIGEARLHPAQLDARHTDCQRGKRAAPGRALLAILCTLL